MPSFQPTYEELKHDAHEPAASTVAGFSAYLRGIETRAPHARDPWPAPSFQPTYEELKLPKTSARHTPR